MQISHTLSEEVEPPSADSPKADAKGYHASKSPLFHDSVHGWNSILKTHHLRKNRLKGNNSLSFFFAPHFSKAGETDGQFGDRFGPFDEDDDRPPSASTSSRSDPGMFDLSKGRTPTLGDYRCPPSSTNNRCFVDSAGLRLWVDFAQTAERSVPFTHKTRFLGLFSGAVSYLSWFRSVPIGHLAPPGISPWDR